MKLMSTGPSGSARVRATSDIAKLDASDQEWLDQQPKQLQEEVVQTVAREPAQTLLASGHLGA